MRVAQTHPRHILQGAQAGGHALPVCDHYSGVPARMRKSLQLQAELMAERGACVFDVTLDCEDGAPVGAELAHAQTVCELVHEAAAGARVAVRVHAVAHPAFASDVRTIVAQVGSRLCHLMLPKVETLADIETACAAVDAAGAPNLPLHALIESPAAVHRAFEIAAHPRVQSLSFGLMDFVSAHAGAIPASAMGVQGQFEHPLVLRAKLEVASACHAHGKVPSHNVVTEFRDTAALRAAARRAAQELGYTRMWSIHPDQIRPIVAAFTPALAEVEQAVAVLTQAAACDWGPVSVDGQLHDRASYRYFWHLIERAQQTGLALPDAVRAWLDA